MNIPATTAAALAEELDARLVGDGRIQVTGLNEIHHVRPGDCCFVDHPKYYKPTLASAASVVLIDKEVACPPGKALLVLENPFAAYNRLVWRARPQVQSREQVSKHATIGTGTYLAPGAVVEPGAVIGDHCWIGPNAVVGEGCRLGDRVKVGGNSVIGGEAFYYKKTAEGYLPWRSGGTVILEDDVELGPSCTIARGVSSATRIGRGSKLDAQVQIGHDCVLGAQCLLAAQVGIAGNTTVGDNCVLLGQAGVAQNITIGPGALIGAQTGVSKDLPGGKQYFGSPARELRTALREMATLRRLAQ